MYLDVDYYYKCITHRYTHGTHNRNSELSSYFHSCHMSTPPPPPPPSPSICCCPFTTYCLSNVKYLIKRLTFHTILIFSLWQTLIFRILIENTKCIMNVYRMCVIPVCGGGIREFGNSMVVFLKSFYFDFGNGFFFFFLNRYD